MSDIPPCLQRRYQAFDNLVADLRSCCPELDNNVAGPSQEDVTEDEEIKLVCQLWNIQHSDVDSREKSETPREENQKENDQVNTQLATSNNVTCFMANIPVKKNNRASPNRGVRNRSDPESNCNSRARRKSPGPGSPDSTNPRTSRTTSPENACCHTVPPGPNPSPAESKPLHFSSTTDTLTKVQKAHPPTKYDSSQTANWSLKPLKSDSLNSDHKSDHATKHPRKQQKRETGSKRDPLSLEKVLSNVSEAEEYDKKTEKRLKELAEKEKLLKEKIQILENKEKDGLELLKQADSMWHSMEQDYKKKIMDSQERQKILVEELQQVDRGVAKWRKIFNDLQLKLTDIAKCEKEIAEKKKQKESDAACLEAEIKALKCRIEKTKKETEAVQKSFDFTKVVNTKTLVNYGSEISALQKQLLNERTSRRKKELEGEHFVRSAREDLTNLSRLLLNKRLENDDLRAEQDDIAKQIELIKQTGEQFKQKTELKLKSINAEIAKIEADIENQNFKCLQCHRYTDTEEMRRLCADCPRCQIEADGDTLDCVCVAVKRKFMENVFENMLTVLESKAQTPSGKAAATAVLDCLKTSPNGKLDTKTRKILQNFILTTTKQNLDLTVVGGAIKTKCEMDAEVYKQLMHCINNIKPTPFENDEANRKMDPCSRWGGNRECHCKKGPGGCICKVKAFSPTKKLNSAKKDTRNKWKKAEVQLAQITPKKSSYNKYDDQVCATSSRQIKTTDMNLTSTGTVPVDPSPPPRSKKTVIDRSASPINNEVYKETVIGSITQQYPDRSHLIIPKLIDSTKAIESEDYNYKKVDQVYSSLTNLLRSDFTKYSAEDTKSKLQKFMFDGSRNNNETIIKVNIKGITTHKTQYLSGVYLKKTSSENFDVVFDKEFEKEYTKIITKSMENVAKCKIDFVETSSGNFVFDIEKTSEKDLVTFEIAKTKFGNFKLLKYPSNNDKDSTESSQLGETSKCQNQQIHSLEDLIRTTYSYDREDLPKGQTMFTLIKLLCFCTNGFFLEPSVMLEITPSSNHCYIRDKIAKPRLLQHFSLPSVRSRKAFPVKWTSSSEATVLLRNDSEVLGKDGILEITESENIIISMPR